MTSHRSIITNLAREIQQSADVADYCREHFGRALAINVGAYASGIPGEEESPFLWIYATDEENESVGSDESFTATLVVAGCVLGDGGEKVIENVEVVRSEVENGLTINGGNVIVEDLRDLIIEVIRDAMAGAYVTRITREENDISHFPLEWAVIRVRFEEPEAL